MDRSSRGVRDSERPHKLRRRLPTGLDVDEATASFDSFVNLTFDKYNHFWANYDCLPLTTPRFFRLAGRLNLAMCHLKREEWIEARNVCDKVIAENAAAEKAYFRRGEARMKLNDHGPAREDFAKCVELDPENAAAKKRLAHCTQLIKAQKEREKRTFANMFDKFAQADTKREEMAK